MKRDTRQGDPLSPYLFLICAELFALMTRQNKNKHSINIPDEEILLSQFAEDTKYFLDGKREFFCSYIHTFTAIVSLFGLNINLYKTTAVWIGSRRNPRLKIMPELNLNRNPVTFIVLDVVFSADTHEMVPISFENKRKQMRKVLNAWSRRNLMPLGKMSYKVLGHFKKEPTY